MPEFKIGDRVRVKSSLILGQSYGNTCFVYDMIKYLGDVFTIEKFDNDGDIIYHGYAFSPEMLQHVDEAIDDEPVNDESVEDSTLFKIGDKVRVRTDLEAGETYGETYFAPRMEKYLGKVFTIEEFDEDGDIIHDQWWFSPEMLEHVDDEQVEYLSQGEQVDHPSHYNHGGMETIDKMRILFGDEAVKTFCRLNAFKYIDRADYKGNKEQDLAKAAWYLNYAKNMEEENDG